MMKDQDHSDLNESSVTTRPTTKPSSVTVVSEIDIKVRNAEWARFCLRHRALEDTTEIAFTRVELPSVEKPTEFRIAAKFSRGKQMSCTLFFVPLGEIEPFPVISYHNRAVDSLREGYCLLVPISEEVAWTSNTWPVSIEELNNFVASITDSQRYLEAWVMQRSSESNQLLVVVVVKGNVCYGYLLGSPKLAGFSKLRVVPIFFEQIGEFEPERLVQVELELSIKSLKALLRHARQLHVESSDAHEDLHLRAALNELVNALEKGAS
jgi:hypothetical protein